MAGEGANQRRFLRMDCALSVQIRSKSGAVEVLTANISRNGVYLRTDSPMAERQLVKLSFSMPDGTPLQVMGMVAHRFFPKDEHPAGPGMGVDFFALSKDDKKIWDRFCLEMEKNSARLHIGEQLQAELSLPGNGGFADPDEIFVLEEEIEPEVFASSIADNYVEPVRRQHPRFAASFLVRLRDRERMLEYYTRDISIGGTFLRTDELKRDGDVIELILVHPETREEFSLESRVVRVITGPKPGDRGMGLEFLPLNADRKNELELFIERGVEVQQDSGEALAQHLEDLSRAVELEADSPRAYAELGRVLLEDREDPGAAVSKLTKAIKLDPGCQSAHQHLALAYALLGQRDLALEHMRTARRLRG